MPKTFVIDTNVLLHDPDAIYAFKDNTVVVSVAVINELDRKKSEPGLIGKHARQVAHTLLTLCQTGDTNGESPLTGVTIPNGHNGKLIFSENALNVERLKISTDDYLISLAESLGGIIVSKDNYLRVKAHLCGVANETYEHDRVVENYTGHIEALAPADLIDDLYHTAKSGTSYSVLEVFDTIKDLYPNQCLTLTSESDPKQSALCIIDKKVKNFSMIKTYNGVKACGIKPLNAEQRYALHLLLDPDIKLVTINGSTGSGKTMLTLAGGIQGACDGLYDNVIVTRQEVAVGGERQAFLPGSKEEKQEPWLAGIYHCLNKIAKTHQPNLSGAMSEGIDKPYKFYIVNDIVSPEALAYIRGCTYDSYIALTEAQNCHPSILKTLVTRAGKSAKVVLEGDVKQIDCVTPRFLDEYSNGLTVTINRWKGDDIYGHISLQKNVRSELSLRAEKHYD